MQLSIGQHARQHRFGDGRGADADARIVPAFGPIAPLEVTMGVTDPQTASTLWVRDIELEIDGVVKATSATGDGPVDAVFKAIEKLAHSGASLQLYSVNAITTGSDSQGEVTVRRGARMFFMPQRPYVPIGTLTARALTEAYLVENGKITAPLDWTKS